MDRQTELDTQWHRGEFWDQRGVCSPKPMGHRPSRPQDQETCTMPHPSRSATFEALVNAYAADLYRYAYWLCSDAAQAEDLVQETFLRAWRALDSLQEEKAAKGWLMTILRRENARRFERVRLDSVPLDELDLERIAGFEDGSTGIEAWMLRNALEALAPEYREPLVLQVLWGYSCEEIGEMLELTAGAVMTRVFRARQKLKAALSGETASAQASTRRA